MISADEKSIADEFERLYFDIIGAIEGDDSTPVELCTLMFSTSCNESVATEFGCVQGEVALLAEWVPAGMKYTERKPGRGLPEEAGINTSLIPSKRSWVLFPKTFSELPVYYKRGSRGFAL